MKLTRRIRSITRKKPGYLVVKGLELMGIKYSRMLLYQLALDESTQNNKTQQQKRIKRVPANRTDLLPAYINSDDAVDSDEVIVLSNNENDSVGYLWLSERDSYYVNPIERNITIPDAYVWKVFVLPKYRKKGFGTELLKQTVRIAHEDNYNTLSAFVAANNFPSRRLFERIGFSTKKEYRYLQIINHKYRKEIHLV